jgi:hypothetical protein
LNLGEYPAFLIQILLHSNRIKLKEAACRKIIKLFAEKKKDTSEKLANGGTAGGGTKGGQTAGNTSDKKIDENSKIEFINLVEPLIKTIKTSNFNLASLAASALVNLCNYSEDIKDIFVQKEGVYAILEYLTCKEEETLLNILRLFLALISKNESIGKQIC